MCRCTAQPNALRPSIEIFAEAVVVFALAWLEKNNNNNQKEDEHSGVLVSWRLTTRQNACNQSDQRVLPATFYSTTVQMHTQYRPITMHELAPATT